MIFLNPDTHWARASTGYCKQVKILDLNFVLTDLILS